METSLRRGFLLLKTGEVMKFSELLEAIQEQATMALA